MHRCHRCSGIASGRYKLTTRTPYGRTEILIEDLCGTCGLTITQHRRTKVVDTPVESNRTPAYIAYYDVERAEIIRLYAAPGTPEQPSAPLPKSTNYTIRHKRRSPNARTVTRFREPLKLTFINDPPPEV